MKKFYILYILLTGIFIGICYKVKDDYFYLPYPNAIEFILAFVLLLISGIILFWRENRGKKLLVGFFSIAVLFGAVNGMNYFYEWHPLNLSLPFTKSQSFEVDDEPYAWEKASPADFGYDDQLVNRFLNEIKKWKRLRSLVVVKNGNIIMEQYQNGSTKYSAFNVHSVTKSIISALTGIAIQKGYLQSEEMLVMPFFQEYHGAKSNQKGLNSITIAHLLSMKGGFKGWDGPQSVEEVFKEGVKEREVGRRFKYYTGAQMLVSGILSKTTNLNTKEFAQKHLFEPLGMHCGFWRKVDGYYAGGDETYFTARDLARFGHLYLNNGNVDGIQLLDSLWVEKSFTNYTQESKAFRELGCYKETGYGYCWWILDFNNKKVYTARGKGGQYILIIPEENIVAVILQEWNLQKDFKAENAYLCQLLSLLSKNGDRLNQI